MKINMKVKMVKTGMVFDEEYDIENNLEPSEYAQNLINNFNNTLRTGESPRELLSVKVIDESPIQTEHHWEKQNLVTIMGRNGAYDNLKCIRCGITARRYGFNHILRDKKYKAKIYDTCEGALYQLEKNRKRKNGNRTKTFGTLP